MVHEITAVEFGQAGMLADQASLECAAEKKKRRGRPVVGALARILRHAPSEFTEGEHHHAVEISLLLHIAAKGPDCLVKHRQLALVGTRLIGVRVKAAERNIIDPRSHAASDQLCHQTQSPPKVGRGIIRAAVSSAQNILHLGRRGHRIQRGALQKIRHVDVRIGRAEKHVDRSAGWRPRIVVWFHRCGIHAALKLVVLRRPDGDRLAGLRPQGLRQLVSDGDARPGIFAGAGRIAITPEPAVRLVFVCIARRLPDLGGTEMRAVRVRVTDTLHDRGLPLPEQGSQILQRRVQTATVIQAVDLGRRNGQARTRFEIRVITVGDHGVESVVAAGQLHDD